MDRDDVKTEDVRSFEYVDSQLRQSEIREAGLRVAVRTLILYAPPDFAAKIVIDTMPMVEWRSLVGLIVEAAEESKQ